MDSEKLSSVCVNELCILYDLSWEYSFQLLTSLKMYLFSSAFYLWIVYIYTN